MNITDIKIRKIFPEGNMLAIVSIVLDDCFAVHDIKVIKNNSRLFVAMPSRQDESGKFRDIVHPTNAEFRGELEAKVLEAYQKCLEEHKA